MTFKGKRAELYSDTKQIIRHFRTKTDIVNAQVHGSGDDSIIALTCKDGKTYLYKSNGQVVRR